MSDQTHIIYYPRDDRWRIELDKGEIHPDDPGAGTPAMVYGPSDDPDPARFGREQSATYTFATTMGILSGDDTEIPTSVHRWLVAKRPEIDKFLGEW